METSLPRPRLAQPSRLFASLRAFLADQNYLVLGLLILAVVLIRLPIDYKRIMQADAGDFGSHIYFALDMLQGRPVAPYLWAHSLWQVMLIGIWWLSRCRIDFWQSAIGLQVLSSLASTLIIYFWYGTLSNKPSAWMRAFWAVTLVVVTPVILPFLLDGKYYFGYIGLANYHNPTVHVLRPFALLMFIIAVEALSRPRHSLWLSGISALIFIVATYLKPNYTLVLLPALGVMVLVWLAQHRPLDWLLLVAGIGLPSVLTLGAQYLVTYINGASGESIAWLPFVVVKMLSGYVLLKFLLSILFPLAITLLFWKWARQDAELLFAWAGFGFGAAQYYLLGETGSRLSFANFAWGLQIGLFILFVVAIRFLLRQQYQYQRLGPLAAKAQYLIYSPHLFAGVLYYVYCFTTRNYV